MPDPPKDPPKGWGENKNFGFFDGKFLTREATTAVYQGTYAGVGLT